MNMAWIKKVYLYMVSLISLVILVIASIMLINLVLKTYVFTKADDAYYYAPKVDCSSIPAPEDVKTNYQVAQSPECSDPEYAKKEREAEKDRQAAQRQNNAAQAIAMILIGAPVFYYHWKLARKEA